MQTVNDEPNLKTKFIQSKVGEILAEVAYDKDHHQNNPLKVFDDLGMSKSVLFVMQLRFYSCF